MADTALLVIDVQRGLFGDPLPVYRGEEVLCRVALLTDKARANGVPIVYLQHDGGPETPTEHGSDGWEIHPQVAPRADDEVIEKRACDGFFGTTLHSALERLGRQPSRDHRLRNGSLR